jgi:hypothetical protein
MKQNIIAFILTSLVLFSIVYVAVQLNNFNDLVIKTMVSGVSHVQN